MLIDILGRIFYNTLLVVSLHLIEKKKIDLKEKNFYFSIIILNLLSFICMSINIFELKPFFNIFILIAVDSVVLKNRLAESIVKVIIMYAVFLTIELIYMLFIILIFDAYTIGELNRVLNEVNQMNMYSFLYNIISSIVFTMIFNMNIFNKIYMKFSLMYFKIKAKGSMMNLSFVFLMLCLTYAVLNFSDKLFLNVVMLIILLIIMSVIYFKDITVRNEYGETKEKYNNVQNSLVEYEEMIDKYRISNHENKNQLLTIQNMINNNDKDINQYIDNLVGTIYMNNEKTMMDVAIIPAGGLRATIHTKLNIMDNNNIKYILNIDRKLRILDFDSINSELNLKICKIISIFIDNAIEEVETHNENRLINIEMYVENDALIIEVCNKFHNKFDIEKICDKRYTTKTSGHGYGLSLAKELIDSESRLNNYIKVEDDFFTQILEIKLKK